MNPDEVYLPIAPSLVVRLDSANVVTLVRAPENLGVSSLYWTVDSGGLWISDGKGYPVRYKLFKEDGISAHLIADAEKGGRRAVANETAIYSNEALRATGFDAGSQLFEGCWSAFEPKTAYCFPADRHFTFTFNDPEFGVYTAYGLFGDLRRVASASIAIGARTEYRWKSAVRF